MELICLSEDSNKPCYLIRYNGITLMLDSALNDSTCLNYLPLQMTQLGIDSTLNKLSNHVIKDHLNSFVEGELKETSLHNLFIDSAPEFGIPDLKGNIDMSEIDAILISNYNCILGLPFITEESSFQGSIYMTEPTLRIGKLFMEETIEYIKRSNKNQRSYEWKNMTSHFNLFQVGVDNPKICKMIYSKEMMESALSKVKLIGFGERVELFGKITISPVSSGYCLGSSYWIISSVNQRIAYLPQSSTLTTHPKPLDQSLLSNIDCLILSSLIHAPMHKPNPMMAEFLKTVIETTKLGGNVLLPCYPSGIIYDLLECLTAQMDQHGLSNIPLYFISPVADSSLAYSNIMAEWLSDNKQNRVYFSEEPFPHSYLTRIGRLKSYKNVHSETFSSEYRQPCVIFCGHPSLRFGDAIHFIELWGSNPNNTMILTEPTFNYTSALSPFQPLHMKTVHCPIDTSLNYSQAKRIIQDLNPKFLAIPCQYLEPSISLHGNDLKHFLSESHRKIIILKRYETLKFSLKLKFESVYINKSFTSALVPKEIFHKKGLCTFTSHLSIDNNRYHIKSMVHHSTKKRTKKVKLSNISLMKDSFLLNSNFAPLKYRISCHFFGNLNVEHLVKKLNQNGFTDVEVSHSIIYLTDKKILINFYKNITHITFKERSKRTQEFRKKIQNICTQSLQRF